MSTSCGKDKIVVGALLSVDMVVICVGENFREVFLTKKTLCFKDEYDDKRLFQSGEEMCFAF